MISQDDLDRHPGWALCTVCGETFAGDSFFDDHRHHGTCLSPDALGLIERDEVWGTAEGFAKRAADALRMRSLRSDGVKSRTGAA